MIFFKGNLNYLNRFYEVHAVSSQKDKIEKVGQEEGIITHYIPMKRPIALMSDIICIFKFVVLFLREHPDIVHGNTPKASMLSMVAAKIAGVKIRIYMCHGLRYQGTNGVLRWLLMKMEKLTCACAKEVICVSKGVRDTLVKDKLCEDRKAVVVHHGSASGIDLEKFNTDLVQHINIRKDLGIAESDFVFIFVGRIVKDKGINELVNAFVKLQLQKKSVHIILVGGEEGNLNPIFEDIHKHIETNGNIHAVGLQKDIRPYLLNSDAFLLPSYREGFGMVLIEAGAMGLPCITTDISGCNEIIIQGENGEIVPPRDEKALYEKMKEWVEQPEKVAEMGSKARVLVESRFEQKMVWNALLEEYRRLEKCS
jgi:glycosyltransferase involved in cell wall biosynthesis